MVSTFLPTGKADIVCNEAVRSAASVMTSQISGLQLAVGLDLLLMGIPREVPMLARRAERLLSMLLLETLAHHTIGASQQNSSLEVMTHSTIVH